MFTAFRRRPAAPEPATGPDPQAGQRSSELTRVMSGISGLTASLGREAAEVRGVLDDTHKIAVTQTNAVHDLVRQLEQVVRAQSGISQEVAQGLQAVALVGDAVQGVGAEVAGIVDTLREVSEAAQQITQIALQTRLVAFNASVEAKRAGDAGRGFGMVADAVKDLAGKVESSSKAIMGTVLQLGSRIDALSREVSRDGRGDGRGDGSGGEPGKVHRALATVEQGVRRIQQASDGSREVCSGLDQQVGRIEGQMRQTVGALDSAFKRTETFLNVAEKLIEHVAECGVETPDSPYIQAVQQAAGQIGTLLEDALRTGTVSAAELFDEHYQPVAGSNPAQVMTRFVALAERLFPQVQEKMLGLSDKVVYCIASDRNGYIACHNKTYNQPQRAGDVVWNTANCRNRRIFNDRTGLASSRNQRPFLLQTYRRDMGGGNFVVMKEAAAPIVVGGRHWGGVRLAFKF